MRLPCCASGRAWAVYVRALGAVDRFVNSRLGSFGALVARKPLAVMLTSLCIALALSGGMLRVVALLETNAERLWCAMRLTACWRADSQTVVLPLTDYKQVHVHRVRSTVRAQQSSKDVLGRSLHVCARAGDTDSHSHASCMPSAAARARAPSKDRPVMCVVGPPVDLDLLFCRYNG
jgi:hypothetical protein